MAHAEAFLDGEIYFRPLSYFVEIEDGNIRGDQLEGRSIYQPSEGLSILKVGDETSIVLKDHRFVAEVETSDIFVFCLSQSLSLNIWDKFNAKCCIEISEISSFCRRIEDNLPKNSKFPKVHGRPKIGNKVIYYDKSRMDNGRYALPDLISISKSRDYLWQDEYRISFTTSDAFEFENTSLKIEPSNSKYSKNSVSKPENLTVSVGDLRNISRKIIF